MHLKDIFIKNSYRLIMLRYWLKASKDHNHTLSKLTVPKQGIFKRYYLLIILGIPICLASWEASYGIIRGIIPNLEIFKKDVIQDIFRDKFSSQKGDASILWLCLRGPNLQSQNAKIRAFFDQHWHNFNIHYWNINKIIWKSRHSFAAPMIRESEISNFIDLIKHIAERR